MVLRIYFFGCYCCWWWLKDALITIDSVGENLNYFTNNKYTYIVLLSLWINPLVSQANSYTIVDIETSRGLITVQLTDDVTPVTVNNFLSYINEGFYGNTLFHRVIDGFMVQGGGFNAKLEVQAVHAPIALETNRGLSNVRGTIAMARRSDPDSATAQFFINTTDNLFLDYQSFSSPGYAVFGEIIEGMDVVDAISNVATGTASSSIGMLSDVPELPVLIEVVRLREAQLRFAELQASYAKGDIITVSLEETMLRQRALDLWVAVLTDDGHLLFVTEQGFSITASAFKSNVSETDTSHPVFELVVPQGLVGHFTLYAIFNNPADGIENLNHSLRSNIATISVDLVQ